MRLSELVAAVHGTFDGPAAMADVAALCTYDRCEGSASVDAVASYVAQRAVDAGLRGVEVMRFPAGAAGRWWTLQGPAAWAPLRASVHVGRIPVVIYPEQRYTLAANSAATAPGGARLRLVHWFTGARPDVAGALVVLDAAPLPAVLDELVAGRAAGVATDPLAIRPDRWPDQVGRIKLPVGCPLFAFSLAEAQMAALRRAARRGAWADVLVEIEDLGVTLPVVTGLIPGSDATGELLISAHLCHPKASASASGVATLLGLARANRVFGCTGQTVRFMWVPESAGMAAYLHEVVAPGRTPLPVTAVNIEMSGGERRRSPLVIERAPDELPSPVSAIAERCAALIPPAGRSYSGAVPYDTWVWRATPFVGASNHAVLTCHPTSCPTINLGQWTGTVDSTDAARAYDVAGYVDPDEICRTATIAGATIAALRSDDPELTADVTDATVAWAVTFVLSAMPGARPLSPPRPAGAVLDPWAPEQMGRLLEYRGEVARAAVRSLHGADPATGWLTGLVAHIMTRFPASTAWAEPPREPDDGDVLTARWDGPMNLGQLTERADPDDRRWLAEITAYDRGGSFARLLALARGIDGHRDRRAVAWWAALTSGLAIPVPMANQFLATLSRAGLATP